MKLMKKNDFVLLSALILLGIAALIVLYAIFGNTGSTVVVTVDGQQTHRLPLNRDAEVTVEGANGGTNLLVIEDGKAYIKEASCPDRICVKTGVADELKSVVCAPNRVVVSIEP